MGYKSIFSNVDKRTFKKLFEGSFVNVTENRFVTHFLERNPNLVVDKIKRYKSFISSLRHKKIKNLINVGIGGSDLGIKMVYQALENERQGPLSLVL